MAIFAQHVHHYGQDALLVILLYAMYVAMIIFILIQVVQNVA